MPVKPGEIDRLYQLPLEEFTAARNALAKAAGGAADVRARAKPPLAAWAVNQLYWHDRRTWDALVAAAENLRRTHKAVLAGRSGDVRAAGTVHDEAVHDALKSTLAILARAGHPATDAVKQAVTNTLRALPSDEPPGRLSRVLQPGGFEMLAGLSIAAGAGAKARKEIRPRSEPRGTNEKAASRSRADVKALTQACEAAAAADRALKEAEQAVRRHEFEIARATRDEERAARSVEQARAAVEEAKHALAAAEREQAEAAKRRKAAQHAAGQAESAVTAARRQAESAAAALKKLG